MAVTSASLCSYFENTAGLSVCSLVAQGSPAPPSDGSPPLHPPRPCLRSLSFNRGLHASGRTPGSHTVGLPPAICQAVSLGLSANCPKRAPCRGHVASNPTAQRAEEWQVAGLPCSSVPRATAPRPLSPQVTLTDFSLKESELPGEHRLKVLRCPSHSHSPRRHMHTWENHSLSRGPW